MAARHAYPCMRVQAAQVQPRIARTLAKCLVSAQACSKAIIVLDVVAAIIESNGVFLACRRNSDRGGLWEFPGGKVEEGELPREAVVREVREELGIEIEPESTLAIVDHEGRQLSVEFMRSRLLGPRPTVSTDHDRLVWLTVGELMSVEWAEADKVAARQLLLLNNRKSIVAAIGEDDA